MSEKQKKKRKVRNRTKDFLFDYVKTNNEYTDENRRRQEEEGVKPQGLKNLNTTEKTCIVVIVLGLIGIVLKYFVFG
ncbi:MAG: hypothetical protein ACI4LD_06820 [Lentihominibacter sp.]